MKKIAVILIIVSLLFSACTKTTDLNNTQQDEVQDTTQQTEMQDDSDDAVTEEVTAEPTAEPKPEPLPNTVAVVIARDSYAAGELTPVLAALAASGYEFIIVSDEMGTAEGYSETREVQKTFSEVSGNDFCGIVLIGGSESLWDNADLHRLLNEVYSLDRVVASICLSTVTLAKAGVLKEGDTASWFNCDSSDAAMTSAGVVDSGQPVTVNGKIITGNGPPAAEEYANEIVAALDAQK